MTVKYGIKTEWWKHLRYTKRPHWKAIRKMWSKILKKDVEKEM